MGANIIKEAKKCIQCKKPQCVVGCPINTPIPEGINLLLNGNLNTAAEIFFENNPLSVVCSLVCANEHQCEGNCILGKKGDPVHISAIENYISGYGLNIFDLKPKEKLNGRRIWCR